VGPCDCRRVRCDLAEKANGLLDMSKIVLPYEPEYVGGREAEKRHKETKEWLRNRERELANSFPIAPEPAPEGEKAP
jgi:hypothetical protein